ncbi:MAG: hypothetical protein N3E41_08810 [Thermofilaceae archaeon]|nr:hypothetical protein [Thermofilaceae archaeon]
MKVAKEVYEKFFQFFPSCCTALIFSYFPDWPDWPFNSFPVAVAH